MMRLKSALAVLSLIGGLGFGAFDAIARADEAGPRARTLDFETTTAPARLIMGEDQGALFELTREHAFAGTGSGVLRLPSSPGQNNTAATAIPIAADAYRGRIVQLSAWLRSEGRDDGVSGLWMRIDRASGSPAFFDNMADRPVRTTEWTRVSIAAPVPQDATTILIGLIKSGEGAIWIDDLRFAVSTEATLNAAKRAAISHYLETAIDALRSVHHQTHILDWDEVKAEAREVAEKAQDTSDVYSFIDDVIARLGDPHTRLIRPVGSSEARGSNLPTQDVRGDISIVALPTLVAAPGATISQQYEAVTRTFTSQPRCGFILDLRDNRGGDMWPMLNGLEPILGTAPFGYFIAPEQPPRAWAVDAAGRVAIVDQVMPSEGRSTPPTAILLGPATASSGELVAVAFMGRNGARSFGSPTLGYTTANLPVVLSDKAVLSITGARVANRETVVVDGPLSPDEPSGAPVEAAIAWLETQGCNAP